MALSWLLLCVRCTKNQYTTLWWLWHGFCSVSHVQKNNIQHCDGFVMASAQCQVYKKTIYNTVMALVWLLLSVRCTKKTIYNTVMALSWLLLSVRCTKKKHTTLWWLCHGFCSVSDVQKINIQHCDGFVVASAQCQMYEKTTYNTVMALSWLLLSVRCTKKKHTTLWWLCHGFCSVSDVQKHNIQHCDGFVMASAQCQMYKKNNIQHWDGFVMASAQCQMYKKTTYNTVMALSWLLLSVRCTNNNIQHCNGFGVASAQCQM